MTSPAPDTGPTAEDLKADIIAALNAAFRGFSFPGGRWSAGYGAEMAADALLSGPLAPILQEAVTARKERDEVRCLVDRLKGEVAAYSTEAELNLEDAAIKETCLEAAREEAAHLRAENANLRDRVREAEGAAEAMQGALDQAEACLSIVEPRTDKAEYLRTLSVVRAALSPSQIGGNPANSAPSRLVQSNPARCTATGNPCGTDTVMAGRQCPDDRWGGRCAHRIAEAAKLALLTQEEGR